ncbi:SMP-30/gluconolactonase/LRE family protein [Salisediminibacterium beveridgei]|nr:SMP-30/gluconolactonase/LRE family protein [Salisediminibacterium beveridgei]
MNAELVLDSRADLGEGPSWDDKRKRLIWVDINGCKLNEFDPVTGLNKAHRFDRPVGAAVPDDQGGYMLALQDGFYSWEPTGNKIICIAQPEGAETPNRFNDGKCDPEGRFWAGTMFYQYGPSAKAHLFRLDGDLSVHTMKREVIISNGMAWNTEQGIMYYIDTLTKKVVAFDYDRQSGHITAERDAVKIPDDYGLADGMTIDGEGMLWIAFFHGWCVRRINPQTGEVLMTIDVPVEKVTSCAFGGEKLDELYITTASEELSPEDLEQQPHAGGLFRVKPGVKGCRATPFIFGT